MRIGPCTLLLALSFAPTLLSQSTSTQTAKAPARKPAATASAKSTTPVTSAPAAPATPVSSAACNCPTPNTVQRRLPPYSAKQTSTRVQTLADGTHITTVTTAQIYRDADGRTRQENLNTLADGTQSRIINTYDPVAHMRMTWTIDNPNMAKVVNVYHYPQPVAQPVTSAPPTAQRYYPTTNQSLPPQTILGLYATGNRSTRTIPAGYEGNDRDMTTTSENWFSQTLGIQIRYSTDDPRTSKMTTETTDIQQTAPDPALFQPPEGYQLKETNQ
jgi:hypothetical protein